MGMTVMRDLICLVLLLFIVAEVDADSWAGSVNTTKDYWSIHRTSSNISFSLEQSVKGTVSPVTVQGGRVLRPYGSYYEDVNLNDVRLRQRTAAHEGSYSSEERLKLKSNTSAVNLRINKPAGTDIYTIDFYENWPVSLSASRTVEYSGEGINDREFAGNNLDYFGANMLYNKEFSKEMSVNMSLKSMNATILANDYNIFSAERKSTRALDLQLKAHTSGIADISYLQSGSQYEFGPTPKYEVLNELDERYVGVYDITKKVSMRSVFTRINLTEGEEWLPCCSGGFFDMPQWEQKARKSEAGIFDCTCSKTPSKAQFQRQE